MKFEIRDRWDGSILFSGEFGSFRLCVEAAIRTRADLTGAFLMDADLTGADLTRADLTGADLTRANLAGANLTGANLADANLARADLADADLSGANLTRAYLAGANLARANLARADLAGANLAGANLARAKGDFATPAESDALLVDIAKIVLDRPERLEMGVWHGSRWDATHTPEEEHSCGTAHCLAGWAQALCPVPMIRRMDPLRAGMMLIPTAAHLFYSDKETVREFLKEKLAKAAP